MTRSQTAIPPAAAEDPDVRLMLRVRDDDDAGAFEELVRRYQTRLLTIFAHYVGGREAAEDLAQEVFLRVYRARKNYVPGAKFATWMYTIANNVASNQRRSLSRRRETNLAPADSGSVGLNTLDQLAQASSGLMPARQLDKAETRDMVRQAVATLSDRQRMAVLLNKFEHMSYAEMAAVMQISPQAIKSLLSRARYNLRDVLEPYLRVGQQPQGTGE